MLFKNFAVFDSKCTGLIPVESAFEVLQQECEAVDRSVIEELLFGFTDKNSDCVFYPELLSFLSNCSLWNVMHKLHNQNIIRKKQGYDVPQFLIKSHKKGTQYDKVKLFDTFLNIGFVIPDISYETIFNKFGEKKKDKYLKVPEFVEALENLDKLFDNAPERKEVSAFRSDNELADKLLRAYDNRLKNVLEKAFDLFDVKKQNEIPSTDLERVLNSVGRKPNVEDLSSLLLKLDPRGKGYLEFNNFMDVTMKYLRDNYDSYKVMSINNLREFFDSIDINKDGTVSPAEFKHVMISSDCGISEDEIAALINLLDIDKDGSVSYEEFQNVYSIMDHPKELQKLDPVIKNALLKLQYSSLPDHEKYLYMFQGMPSNYRLSVLADLEKDPAKNLANLAREESEIDGSGLKFDIQINRVSGVPSENEGRSEDMLIRGLRYGLCRTTKPPTFDDIGNDPEFIGNIIKLHATLNPKNKDVWQFSNKEDFGIKLFCINLHIYIFNCINFLRSR